MTPAERGPTLPKPLQVLGRNDSCWCESGRKAKVCHGDGPIYPPADDPTIEPHYALNVLPNVWGAFCDDTVVERGFGDVADGTTAWNAVLVPPGRTRAFSKASHAIVTSYATRWGLDAIHWWDLLNRKDLRGRVALEEILEFAYLLNELIDRHSVAILMSSTAPGSLSDNPVGVDALRKVGLATGRPDDDWAFAELMTSINEFVEAERKSPTDRVIVFANTRGGGRWSKPGSALGGSLVELAWPRFAGTSIYLAPKDLPEMSVADYVAYSYSSAIRRVADGRTGGIYRELLHAFGGINHLRTSRKMKFDLFKARDTEDASRTVEMVAELAEIGDDKSQ